MWVFDVKTGSKKKIYEGIITTIWPIISPDDSFIGIDTGGRYFSLFDVNGNLVKNLEAGGGIEPSWSPDGLHIAYLRGKVDPATEILLEQHIHIINTETGVDKDLTPVPGLQIEGFKWLNDSTIVY